MGRAAKNRGCKAGMLDAAQVAGAAVAIAEAVAKAAAQAAEPAPASSAGCDAVGDTVCEGCGEALAEGQWLVTLLDSGLRCHYECWRSCISCACSELDQQKAAQEQPKKCMIYAPADRVMATLPAGDFKAINHDLKQVRRELNFMKTLEQQLRNEMLGVKKEVADATRLYIATCGERDAISGERDMATAELDAAVENRDAAMAEAAMSDKRAAERQTELQKTIDELKQDFARERAHVRFLTGKTVDKLNEAQRTHLRAELQAALDCVDAWEAA
jgi:hypothetical protein